MFSSDDDRTAETASVAQPIAGPSFAFQVASGESLNDLAERVAQHALKCWVRNDPTYQVGGPFENGSASNVTLIKVAGPENTQDIEALRLAMRSTGEGSYAVEAAGPLATDEFTPRIRDGVTFAASGQEGCN